MSFSGGGDPVRYSKELARKYGRLMMTDGAAAYLKIRRCDFEHLVRAKWVEPVKWVRSTWRPRRYGPDCPLYRARDLDVLLSHPAIDWEAVRSTPSGRPSPLARLSRPKRRGTPDSTAR